MKHLLLKCHICDKISQKPHYKSCGEGIKRDDFKFQFLMYNYSELKLYSKDYLEHLYLDQQFSLPDFKNQFELSYRSTTFLLNYFSIECRTQSESQLTTNTRNKMETTCKEKYGAINPLSKGTEPFNKRNNTIQERYGVNNVYQVQSVIDKITETHLLKYGAKRLTDGQKISDTRNNFTSEKWKEINAKTKQTRDNWTDEEKKKNSEKISTAVKKWWANISDEMLESIFFPSGKMNKLESRISAALTRISVPFTYSKFVAKKQFDFRIHETNILIEVNGDFWHANPRIYKSTDTVKIPNGNTTAENIWNKDKKKKQLAESYGYKVLYLWEYDISKLSDDELDNWLSEIILTQCKELISDKLINSSITSQFL